MYLALTFVASPCRVIKDSVAPLAHLDQHPKWKEDRRLCTYLDHR